ncbi:BMP family ABC transporter substrate-binding protein [Desulfoluna sp.]|uniref:BMP family lipoprotein n=1 Tax=Desulfoluna sp. TaxID=2045199 RepID=UPI00261F86C8|nr:BMP family ABC transporter substrate-binding protein [Desulfoluna sp.]
MMKKVICSLTVALFVLVAVLPGITSAKTLKVGLVTDVGRVDDSTFNEFAYNGMMRAARDFRIETAFIETHQPSDYEKNIAKFVEEDYDVIITMGYMVWDATQSMARKYPGTQFISVDHANDPAVENIMGLVFAENEAGFMAGALAAMMSKTQAIGVVAGIEIPPVIRYRKGYEAGAKYVDPDCEVFGVYIDSFTDPVRGQAAALSQMEQGADVIFGAGGKTGSGAIKFAAQKGAWVIGVDQDEYMTSFMKGTVPASDHLISSAMKRVDNAVYQAIETTVKGHFAGGTRVFNIKNNGIGLAPFHQADPSISGEIKARLAQIEKMIKSGKIVVPGL